MYYRHFGLDSAPFRFVPSGRDLYLSRSHREALAALEWGVMYEPSGFTLLIGEAGTGKTTLVKSILARNYDRVRTACINNPKRGFEGILRELVRQFGLTTLPTKLDMSAAFDDFLERLKPDERVVILIDEAQTLDEESLEELRLFSNAGNGEEKQLHFVLVGQPELIHRLMRRELRQLNDRIGARAVLNPLSAAEARAYLEFRLTAHGGSAARIFDSAALDYIVAHSGGIPRRINVLGHNALLLAYSTGKQKVDLQSARAATAEYESLLDPNKRERNKPAASRWQRLGLAAAGFAGLLVIILIEAGSADGPRHTGINYSGDLALKPPTQLVTKLIGASPSGPQTASVSTEPNPQHAAESPIRPEGATGVSKPLSSAATGQQPRREIRVRHGDTLQHLAVRYLGTRDRLQSLIDANPQLRNFNLIYPGQTVYLPASASQE